MLLIKELWAMFDTWNEAGIVSPYTKRAALRLKTKALIAEDKHHAI